MAQDFRAEVELTSDVTRDSFQTPQNDGSVSDAIPPSLDQAFSIEASGATVDSPSVSDLGSAATIGDLAPTRMDAEFDIPKSPPDLSSPDMSFSGESIDGQIGTGGTAENRDARIDTIQLIDARTDIPPVPPSRCMIHGTLYDGETRNPTNACQVCKPVESPSEWSNVPDGLACGGGPYCSANIEYGQATCKDGACAAAPSRTCHSTGCNLAGTACNPPCLSSQTTCGTTCCNSNQYCASNGNCGAKAANGVACPNGSDQCESGFCVSGHCCGESHCGPGQTCASGNCKCLGYTFPSSCAGVCGTWTFDSGSAEGWVKDTNPFMPVNGGARNGVTNVLSSQNHQDGSHALAFPALIDLVNTYNASVMVPICPGGTINLSGYTMSAWIYLSGSSLGSDTFLFFDAWGPSTMISSPALMGESLNRLNTWQQATATFTSPVQADHISIRLNDPPGWTGTVYVDSVTITPP